MHSNIPSASRSAIIDAAVCLFGKKSYTATSMREIANAVGVLPGSLYAHISSKEELLIDIVDIGISTFLRAVEPFVDSRVPAKERMSGAIKAHVKVVAENPERSLVVFHQWRFLGPAAIVAAVEKRRKYEQMYARILKDGVESGEFDRYINERIVVFSFLGAMNWVPEWYSHSGPFLPDKIGDMIADTLLTGIMPRPLVSQ